MFFYRIYENILHSFLFSLIAKKKKIKKVFPEFFSVQIKFTLKNQQILFYLLKFLQRFYVTLVVL